MTLKEIKEFYCKIFYLEDDSVIDLVLGVTLANRMSGDPIWLMIVGGSSSGKTEIINGITGLEFVHELTTLTPNTLLSGMKARKGGETSFLLRIQRTSIIVMKDFTTILSMNRDDQQSIMAQFREMYDGKMTKATGTGDTIKWEGKISLIAGVTEKLYMMESRFSGMGTRALNYVMPFQDRMKTGRRAAEISGKIKEHRLAIKDAFTSYVKEMVPIITEKEHVVPDEVSERILHVTDFASLARSPVERDFKGHIELTLSPEMPMRMSNQAHRLGAVFMAMSNGVLEKHHEQILYKIALDSIPKGRRITLRELASYSDITTKGLAMKLNYSTERTRMWLEELNVLGICDRNTGAGNQGDKWKIKDEYKDIMRGFDGVEKKEGTLIEEDEFIPASTVDKEWESVGNDDDE